MLGLKTLGQLLWTGYNVGGHHVFDRSHNLRIPRLQLPGHAQSLNSPGNLPTRILNTPEFQDVPTSEEITDDWLKKIKERAAKLVKAAQLYQQGSDEEIKAIEALTNMCQNFYKVQIAKSKALIEQNKSAYEYLSQLTDQEVALDAFFDNADLKAQIAEAHIRKNSTFRFLRATEELNKIQSQIEGRKAKPQQQKTSQQAA